MKKDGEIEEKGSGKFDPVTEISAEFRINITRDGRGVTRLEIVPTVRGEKVGDVRRFEFEGVEGLRLVRAVTDFENYLFWNLPFFASELFGALYWRPLPDDPRDRLDPREKETATKELQEKIKRFQKTFRKIMIPSRRKEVPDSDAEREDWGTVTRYMEVRTGRNPIPAEDKEERKVDFVNLIYGIFKELGDIKRTQIEAARILIERERKKEKKGKERKKDSYLEKWLQHRTRELGLKWSDLKKENYQENRSNIKDILTEPHSV